MRIGKNPRLAGALVALAAALATAPTAGAAQPVRYGLLQSVPLGYLGCFHPVQNPPDAWCLVAHTVSTGVRVIFAGGADSQVLGFREVYVEDVVVPEGSLTTFPTIVGPGVWLKADLPRTGAIDLRSQAEDLAVGAGNFGCLNYAVNYEIQADQGEMVGASTNDWGTIAGAQVRDAGCNAYFFGPTSGLWVMSVLLEEGSTPTP